jgi:hypothetical protein
MATTSKTSARATAIESPVEATATEQESVTALTPDDVQDVAPADPRQVGEKVRLTNDRGEDVIGTVVAPVDDHHVLVQAHGVEASVALSKLKSA